MQAPIAPSATGSPQSLSGGDSPAPAKRGGIRRRFSVSSGTTKSSAIPEAVDTFDAKDEKGKSVKLVAGTMGLQVSGKKGIPTTHLYQGINAWETKDHLEYQDGLVLEVILAPAAGQPTQRVLSFTTEDAATISERMHAATRSLGEAMRQAPPRPRPRHARSARSGRPCTDRQI